VTVRIGVPESEFERWETEARRQNMTVDEWLRRVSNFVLDAEVEGAKVISTGRQRMLASIAVKCAWCGDGLGVNRSIRKKYCSDNCRVLAWRMRKRLEAASNH
jgi:hypothetical protein